MKILQVLCVYKDIQLNRNTVVGELLEVSNKRAETLLAHEGNGVTKLVKLVETYPEFDLTPPLKSPEEIKELYS